MNKDCIIGVMFSYYKALSLIRAYAKTKSTPLNPPDIRGRLCPLSYVGEGWGEVFA